MFKEIEKEAEEWNGEPDLTTEFEELANLELKEFVIGDYSPLLVVHRAYFALKKVERHVWLRNNIL